MKKIVSPVLKPDTDTEIVYVDFSFDKLQLGGSSFAQILNRVGKVTPDVKDADYFANAFTTIQRLVEEGYVLAGHDISAGVWLQPCWKCVLPTIVWDWISTSRIWPRKIG